MQIQRLDGSSLRNLQPFSLRPALLNLLVGENGSGKSSTVEAIHLLATGRSFRGGRADGAICHGEPGLTLFLAGVEADGRERRVGYQKPRGQDPVNRLDGEDATLGDIASVLPVRFMGPGSEELLEGEPAQRRSFLDWILFHVEHGYLDLWRRGNRALAQRNALLRAKATPALLKPWTHELLEASTTIGAMRQQALYWLAVHLEPLLARFDFAETVSLAYHATALPESDDSWAALATRERENGYSLFGFQRDDVRIRVADGAARDILSRGQKKVLVYALQLAEASLVRAKTGKISVLLLDDLCSELDRRNAAHVLRLVVETGMQAFITALNKNELDGLLPPNCRLFHVEHGRIRQDPEAQLVDDA